MLRQHSKYSRMASYGAVCSNASTLVATKKLESGEDAEHSQKLLFSGKTVQASSSENGGLSKTLLKEPSGLNDRRKLFVGLLIVLIVAFSWVGSTQTAKSSYTGGFSAPYFVMWFSTAWMILVFPLTAPLYFITGRAKFNVVGIQDLWR